MRLFICKILYLSVIFSLESVFCATRALCRSQGVLQFQSRPPQPRTDLTFCNEHRRLTCCNRTHTTKITRTVHPYYDQDFNSDCRAHGVSIACSPCDSDVGTEVKEGICQPLCDKWYKACKSEFFFFDGVDKVLKPCADDSLVCSRLRHMASSGTEFCTKSGFEVAEGFSTTCFDGNPTRHPFPDPPFWKRMLLDWKRIRRRLHPAVALFLELSVTLILPVLMLLVIWRVMPSSSTEISTSEMRQRRLDRLTNQTLVNPNQNFDITKLGFDAATTTVGQTETSQLSSQMSQVHTPSDVTAEVIGDAKGESCFSYGDDESQHSAEGSISQLQSDDLGGQHCSELDELSTEKRRSERGTTQVHGMKPEPEKRKSNASTDVTEMQMPKVEPAPVWEQIK